MRRLLKCCRKCRRYTLKSVCPLCKERTVSAHPAKFSLCDKWWKFKVRWRYTGKEE